MKRILPAVSILLLHAAPALRADDFSLRAGAYLDAESAFVGAEYRFPITRELKLAPNLEWVFPDDVTYFGLSMDLHYDFRTKSRLQPWLGGGLGIYVVNPEGPGGGDTDVGANFIGGLGLKGELMPYVQLKVVVKGDTETVLAFGLRF
jgi:hypothetical protein